MGLKESGLRGSLRNVSVGIDAIPDSVVYQSIIGEQEQSEGETIDTLVDQVSAENLSANGSPTYREDGINGNPAAELDGSNDEWTTSDWGLSISRPYSITTVIDVNESVSEQLILRGDKGDGTSAINYRAVWQDQDVQFLSNNALSAGSNSQDGNPMVVTAVAENGGDGELRINGTVAATGNTGDQDFTDVVGNPLAIGSENGSRFLDGFLSELTIADSPSSDDIDNIESSAADRNGISI